MAYENENRSSGDKSGDHPCGINEFMFDESFTPGSDFFHYVNNRWIQENPIPDDYTRWGGFEILHEDNLKRIHSLITDYKPVASENSDARDPFENLVTLYNKGMEEEVLEQQGISSANSYIQNFCN